MIQKFDVCQTAVWKQTRTSWILPPQSNWVYQNIRCENDLRDLEYTQTMRKWPSKRLRRLEFRRQINIHAYRGKRLRCTLYLKGIFYKTAIDVFWGLFLSLQLLVPSSDGPVPLGMLKHVQQELLLACMTHQKLWKSSYSFESTVHRLQSFLESSIVKRNATQQAY